MTPITQITITAFAARLGVHPVTVRRRAKTDPSFPQPRRLPSGELVFDEEEAARTLGASGWQTLWRVTLPNVKWGLLYGVILCNARAMGEFGAVSVVSGHIRGLTNTIPLHAEILYNEYNSVAAFAMASLLTLLTLVTIALKALIDRKSQIAVGEVEERALAEAA